MHGCNNLLIMIFRKVLNDFINYLSWTKYRWMVKGYKLSNSRNAWTNTTNLLIQNKAWSAEQNAKPTKDIFGRLSNSKTQNSYGIVAFRIGRSSANQKPELTRDILWASKYRKYGGTLDLNMLKCVRVCSLCPESDFIGLWTLSLWRNRGCT